MQPVKFKKGAAGQSTLRNVWVYPCFLFRCPQDVFLERHGVKLGFMSAFVRAAAEALREVPAVNAVIEGDEIVYRCVGRWGSGAAWAISAV